MAMELPPINMEDFAKWKSGNAVIQVRSQNLIKRHEELMSIIGD